MNPCEGCALRLFNKKHHNLNGIGNPLMGNCIVVPNVDYDAYKLGDMSFSKQVEIIRKCVSSTGDCEELDDVYIVPLIRCNTNLGCQVNADIYNKCSKHFFADLLKYDFKHVLVLGDAARYITKCNPSEYLDYAMVTKPESYRNITFNVNYSPFIKYTDNERFKDFNKYLRKWINYAVHHFFNYEHIIEV